MSYAQTPERLRAVAERNKINLARWKARRAHGFQAPDLRGAIETLTFTALDAKAHIDLVSKHLEVQA